MKLEHVTNSGLQGLCSKLYNVEFTGHATARENREANISPTAERKQCSVTARHQKPILQKKAATGIQEVQPIATHSEASVIHMTETDAMSNIKQQKVKLSLGLIKYNIMKAYGGASQHHMEVQCQ
jgi:hypothetical protein